MPQRQTEAQHPTGAGLHLQPGVAVLSAVLEGQIAALNAIRPATAALERAADAASAALLSGGKLAYAGAGSSGLMALADCLELAGTFGIPPDRTPMLFAGGAAALLHMIGSVEDDQAQAGRDVAVAGIGKGDVVLCLAASGGTPYTLAVAQTAKALGAHVVGLANTEGAALLALADTPVLLDTGPEIVAGSTRLGAATAQKTALNMISVLVGIRLGAVHDGYMVNLTADNAKLLIRARNIVMAVAACAPEVAERALQATNGAVKPAILVARGASLAAATTALDQSAGHLTPHLN